MTNLHGKAAVRAALLGSVAAITFALPAVAQENQSMETVIVTGIRGSLQRSLDIKRESAGVVDAISMEDIGKFPDSNLAAALMRIPGVTVTRAGMMGVATTGEATQITVRGMGPTFNETLFNGRRIPSAVGGRAFDFSGLSADMVSALEVYKSPDASLSAGAIGATVNVKYPNPFDKDGLTLAGSVSGKYQPNDGRITPNANFLFSDTFFNGKVGLLVAGAYSKIATTQFQVSNWGWIGHKTVQPCQLAGYSGPDCSTISADPTKPNYNINAVAIAKNNWFTQDLSYDYNQIQEERKNARISLQFQPSDALLVTLDANYARDFVYENQYAFAIWNSKGDMRNIKTSSNGTIVSFQRYAPTDFDTNVNMGINQTYDIGLNLKYEASNHLSMILDLDQSQSSYNPGDHWSGYSTDYGYGPSWSGGTNGTTFEVVQPGGKTLPYYKNYGPNGDASRFADTSIMGSHVTTTSATRNRSFVNQVKLEADWKEDNLTAKFGVNYVADHYHMDYWGPWETNRWQWWSGYGPDSNNPTGVHLPSDLFHGKVYLPSMPGWDSSNAIPYLLKVSAADVWSYLNSLPTTTPGFNAGCCSAPYQGITPAGINTKSDGSHQVVYEDTFAVFASVATEARFAGMPLKINAGVRYEYTSVDTRGIDKPLATLYQVPGDLTAFGYTYSSATNTSEKSSYQYLLPNLDFVLQATDDLQLRFNASRTLTRPNLGDLKPNKSGWGGRVGSLGVSGGNPGELPFLSDNVDFGAEWYYAPNSYFAATTFLKSISNYVVTGTSKYVTDGQNGRPNVIDPTTGTFAVFTLTQPVNGPKANVYGMEIAWQHMFGDSGFGYQLNGTIVQSDKPFRAFDAAGSPTENAFAMTGLADSFNAVAFYDKDGFEIRLAANWRDTYLNNFGQGQSSGTQFGSEPVFVNGVWTLDASTSYDITDNLNVYFEANNLMDVGYSTRGRFADQVLDVISTGRRFTFGAHYKL